MLPTIPETQDTMRALLCSFRQRDPATYCEVCRRILPLEALSSDALSDRQLEVISGIMLRASTRLAQKRALAKLH